MGLRPERMSKMSVTGAKRVIDDVIEATYNHHSLHVTDYDGRYDGFDPGTSLSGAETVNDRLVTVRSLKSILDVDERRVSAAGQLDDETLRVELERVRDRVNELTDRRDELRASLRDQQEAIDRVAPFADLGIALDLLDGYDSLEVVVGRTRADAVETALTNADDVAAFDVFTGDDVVAAFAAPADDAGTGVLQDALVGVDIAVLEVPDAETDPDAYVDELEAERDELRAEIAGVDEKLAALREEAADFLVRAEEQLAIEAEKKQAPLSFATTENAFVAEGWMPTATVAEFESVVADAVGDHAEVEELHQASYTADGSHHTEPVGASADADTDHEAATDGGHAAEPAEDPPVVQNNGGAAGPFELLVQGFGRPRYSEFDPTLLVFLTFPAMFGFMIGDAGYGILYAVIGYVLYARYEGTFRELGAVAMWAGGFTILFGIYFGIDVFGYHAYQLLGIHWPIDGKGLSPADIDWALSWLVVSVLFGALHLNIGYVLSFVGNYQRHDLAHAVYESASWLLLLNGAWIWIFSRHVLGPKPDFLFESFSVLTLGAVTFSGLPAGVGIAGLVAAGVGLVLLAIGEPAELAEVLSPVVNVISYARIMAVLLAKGGMALAVNLLAFGAYIDDGGEGSYHFIFSPEYLAYIRDHPESYELVFAGMTTAFEPSLVGALALIGGIVVAVVGHIVVLLLGVSSAGIQAVRLEYVEFFGKFYDSGGEAYTPLGRERQFTSDE